MAALADELPRPPETPRGVEALPRSGPGGVLVWKYRTRWKDPITGRRVPSPVYDTIDEVMAFRGLQFVARARGDVLKLTRDTTTVEQFSDVEYWRRWAPEFLARSTIASDSSVYRNHITPRIGRTQLRQLGTSRVEDWRDELRADGVGIPTINRAMTILSAICARAVAGGIIDVNPVREVRKLQAPKHALFYTPGAVQIEAILRELDPMSAALASLIGYEGLRPSEALGLEEHHLRARTILVAQRAIGGELVLGLKNSGSKDRDSRSPRLYDAVRQDVDRHLKHRGPADRRARRRLLFPAAGGRPWTTYEYRRWRETVFAPAIERAGVPIDRPYDLRHGAASMLLHSGRPLKEIADHMGHTVTTLDRYYAHLIEELRDTDPVAVELQIAAARNPTQEGSMRQD
jgi:integrase